MKVWITRDVGMKDVVELWLERLPKFTGKTWNGPNEAQKGVSDDFCMSAFGKVPDEGEILEVELKVVKVIGVKEMVDEKALARKLAKIIEVWGHINMMSHDEYAVVIKALKQFAQSAG